MEVKLRNVLSSDLQPIMELVKSVDRMLSAEEVRTWMAVDPGGQFLAETHGHGKTLVGICCGTRLGPDLGFMGLFVVREEFRGRGIGSRLWKAARDHLGDRNIGVRGDEANFKNYTEREGFRHVEDYEIHYYECFGDALPASIVRPAKVDMATFVEGRLIGLWKDLSKDHSVEQPTWPGDDSNEFLPWPSRFTDEKSDTTINQIHYREDKGNKSVTTDLTSPQANRPPNAIISAGSCGSNETSASPVGAEGGVITPLTNPTYLGALSSRTDSDAVEDVVAQQTDKALGFKDGKLVNESESPSYLGQFPSRETVSSLGDRHPVGNSSGHAGVEEVNALVNKVLFIDDRTDGQSPEKTELSCKGRDFQLRSASPEGEIASHPSEMPCGKDRGLSLQPESETLQIYWGGAGILSEVVAFDRRLHHRDRSFVVRQTFSWLSCRSKVALISGRVVGYGCLRRVVTDHWIVSPFYADSEAIAEVILFDLLHGFDFRRAPKGVVVRFPDKNVVCRRLVEKFGFRRGENFAIMTGFTKQRLQKDTSKVYSFHSVVFCSE